MNGDKIRKQRWGVVSGKSGRAPPPSVPRERNIGWPCWGLRQPREAEGVVPVWAALQPTVD